MNKKSNAQNEKQNQSLNSQQESLSQKNDQSQKQDQSISQRNDQSISQRNDQSLNQDQEKSQEMVVDFNLPKFQNLPIKEYYGQDFMKALQNGLRQIAIQQPNNPIKFLGEYLVNYKG